MKDCDREGEGFLNWLLTSVILICIISVVVALGGCASMPGPPQPTPNLTAQGTNPNCVLWCHVVITTAKADSSVESDGTAPITTGSQTIDLDSTMSSSKSSSVGVDPR